MTPPAVKPLEPLAPGVKLLLLPEIVVKLALGANFKRNGGSMYVSFDSEAIELHEQDFDLAAKAAAKLKARVPQNLSISKILELSGFAHKFLTEEIFYPGLIRVLYFQSTILGVAFWRSIVPTTAINTGSKVMAHLVSPRRSAREALDHDIVVFHAGHDPTTLQCAKALQELGKKVVFDFDDDYLGLKPWHCGYEAYSNPTDQEELKRMLAQVDAVTVSTEYLGKKYSQYAKRVVVIPNYIPLANWPVAEPHETGEFRVLWAGGSSHYGDLGVVSEALCEFAARHSDVRLIFLGRDPVGLGAVKDQVKALPWVPLERYPGAVAEVQADVAIAPLEDSEFNRCKSNIKLLEMTATGYPVIASDVGPYHDTIEHGKTGILCKTRANWLDALEMMYNPETRREFAEDGKEICRKFDVVRNRQVFEDFFSGLV